MLGVQVFFMDVWLCLDTFMLPGLVCHGVANVIFNFNNETPLLTIYYPLWLLTLVP